MNFFNKMLLKFTLNRAAKNMQKCLPFMRKALDEGNFAAAQREMSFIIKDGSTIMGAVLALEGITNFNESIALSILQNDPKYIQAALVMSTALPMMEELLEPFEDFLIDPK